MIYPQFGLAGKARFLRTPALPRASTFAPQESQGKFVFPQLGGFARGKVGKMPPTPPMVPSRPPSRQNLPDPVGRLQGWSLSKLLGQVQRKLYPAPAGNAKVPLFNYEGTGTPYYDTGYGLYRTAAGAWKFRTATGDVARAYVQMLRLRPRHWADPQNVTPVVRPVGHTQSLPVVRGHQREIYARTTEGTSRYQFIRLYLSTFTPAVFYMQPYSQTTIKYAITPKRMGTFGVVPLQTQGTVPKRWPWQTTPHGFPVAGSWPMGISG